MIKERIRYECFTPIVNFDISSPKKWIKISNLKIKRVSNDDLWTYFRISQRELNEQGRVLSVSTPEPSALNTMIFKESIVYKLHESEYAMVSDLKREQHIEEVKKVIGAIRLLRFTGVICPISFQKRKLVRSFVHPMETKVIEKSQFLDSDIAFIKDTVGLVTKVDPGDLEILDFVSEHGESNLSLALLVMLLEKTIMEGDTSPTERSFKIRLYSAKLLSKFYDYAEKEVFLRINDAYKLRSGFVHELQESSNQVKELFLHIYDYVVKILRIKACSPSILKSENRNNLLLVS